MSSTSIQYGRVRGGSGAAGEALCYNGAFWLPAAAFPSGSPGTAMQAWSDGQTIQISVPNPSTPGGTGGGSTLTGSFTMPAIGSTVTPVNVADGTAFSQGYGVAITVSGLPSYMTVTLVSGNVLTLLNNGGPTNVAPTSSVPGGSVITVSSTNGPIAGAAPGEGDALINTSGSYLPTGVRPNVNPKKFGAVCDCKFAGMVGQMTLAGNDLTLSAGTPFVAGDVGKHITVTGAGSAGADLNTTIATFVSSSHVTTVATAGTTVPNAAAFPPVQLGWVIWGTDDSAAWSSAITAAAATSPGRVLYVPASSYLVSQQTIPSNVAFECEESAVVHSEAMLNVWGRLRAHETQQIFSQPTQVSFLNQAAGTPLTPIVHSGWWGAVGDNATDNTVALRSGLAAAGSVGNVGQGSVGGTFQLGYGWYQYTDSLTVSQFATGVAGLHILGHNKGSSGGSDNTVLVMNFAERNGTAASLNTSGVLTTGGGDPAWQASDVGTWVFIKNGTTLGPGPQSTGSPAVTVSQGGIDFCSQLKVRILTSGAVGAATFSFQQNNGGVTTHTTAASVVIGSYTLTFPAGTYQGNLALNAAGGGAPAVSLASALTCPFEFSVIVSTSGTLPSAMVQISTDNGNTYAAPQAIASGSIIVTLPQGTATFTFPAGTYTAGTHSWSSAVPMQWFFHTNIGAWQISQFNSATSVNISSLSTNTDPSFQFAPVAQSGITWYHPTRTGLRIWSRDCIVEGLGIQPANLTYCYAAIEDTQGDVSVACTNNRFIRVSIQVLGLGLNSCLIHGFSHADNPATPGRNNNTILDCENDRYIDCNATGFSFAGFYCPNSSGQSKATTFTKTHFLGQGVGNRNARCCVYNFSGEIKSSDGCAWGSTRTMITPIITTPILISDVESEQCDRIMWAPNATNGTVMYTFLSGRIDPTAIAEDGLAINQGQGVRLNMYGLQVDPEIVPHWRIGVQNSGTIRATISAIGCSFPSAQPIRHPQLLSSNRLALVYQNNAGTDESGNAIDTPDVVGVTYGS